MWGRPRRGDCGERGAQRPGDPRQKLSGGKVSTASSMISPFLLEGEWRVQLLTPAQPPIGFTYTRLPTSITTLRHLHLPRIRAQGQPRASQDRRRPRGIEGLTGTQEQQGAKDRLVLAIAIIRASYHPWECGIKPSQDLPIHQIGKIGPSP